MPKNAAISRQARQQGERVRAWLCLFMAHGLPKRATKEELWSGAKNKIAVSRTAFDVGRGSAIHDTGRQDCMSR
jgi:hypothetical protein